MPVTSTIGSIITWPFRQVAGALRRGRRFVVSDLSTQEAIPPSIHDTAVWFANQLHLALGWGSPGEQLVASIVLAIATFFAGIVTAGLAWAIIGLWLLTATIGTARFVPAIDRLWPLEPPGPAILRVGSGRVD